MLPWRGLKSSSRVVMAGRASADQRDGARRFEIVGVSNESASGPDWLNVENPQSNQPHVPRRRRRFYLAIRGRSLSPTEGFLPDARELSIERERARSCSLRASPLR